MTPLQFFAEIAAPVFYCIGVSFAVSNAVRTRSTLDRFVAAREALDEARESQDESLRGGIAAYMKATTDISAAVTTLHARVQSLEQAEVEMKQIIIQQGLAMLEAGIACPAATRLAEALGILRERREESVEKNPGKDVVH
jgi:hypothetical protein